MIGFASHRSAPAASRALASTVAELTLRANLPCGRRNAAVGQLPSCFGQTNPTDRSTAVADEPFGRLERIRQTNPTDNDISANEASFRKRSQLPQTKPMVKS
jgi:hypothetical protein